MLKCTRRGENFLELPLSSAIPPIPKIIGRAAALLIYVYTKILCMIENSKPVIEINKYINARFSVLTMEERVRVRVSVSARLYCNQI